MNSTTKDSLNVLYQNCRGLKTDKLIYYKSLINEGHFDLVVIAESWHPRFLQISPDPYILSSSPNHSLRASGHADGGVCVLALPSCHHEFTCSTLIDFISVKHQNFPAMSFCYLPPSLTEDTLDARVVHWPQTDMLVGDLNMALRGALPRKNDCLLRYCLANHLAYQPCLPVSAKLDHVLAKHEAISRLELLHQSNQCIVTDHPALCFTVQGIDGQQDEQADTPLKSYQFDLRPLRHHEVTASLMADFYQEHAASEISRDIARCSQTLNEIKRTSPEDLAEFAQSTINYLDEAILNMVQQTAEYILGRRQPRSARHLTFGLTGKGPRTPSETLIAYSRLRGESKSIHSRYLSSGSEGLTPVRDAYDRWSTFWSDDTLTIPEQRLPGISPVSYFIDVKLIRKLVARQPNKASHADGIHASILQALNKSSFPHHLVSLYNLCIKYQCTPHRWNHAFTTLMAKTDQNTTAECRPLSIVPLFRALFEKALLPAIDPHLTRLHPAQTGFRPKQSTLTHLSTVHNSSARVKVFIDYEKAFDSPKFKDLKSSWKSFGLPSFLQNLFAALYTTQMSCVLVVNGYQSQKITRSKGIFQGTVLSPHIFNVFTDELVHRLNPSFPLRTTLLAFADDHSLLANSLAEARDLLRIAIAWATPKGLKINGQKSSIIDATSETSMIKEKEMTIKSVKRQTYLGLPFTKDGIDWEFYYKENITQAKKFLNVLCYQTRSWPLMSRAHLYRTFVRPTFEYANVLFAIQSVNLDTLEVTSFKEVWKEIVQFHENACRIICRQGSFNRLLPQILGELSPIARAREMALRCVINQAPFTQQLDKLSIIVSFELWNDATQRRWPDMITLKQRLARFLEHDHPKKIDYRLEADIQEHLMYFYRKSFAYKRPCICGQPFTQIAHLDCLPSPHGDITILLAEKDIEKIHETFRNWWNILNHS